MHLKKIISEGQRKPNKIWVEQVSEFYNQSFKDFLKINNIEMYSTYNEGNSVVAERFIRTLKNKIFKHMVTISKNVYIDVLNEEPNKKDPKFKASDHVRIFKYKNIFAKGYVPNWSEEVLIVNEIRNTVPWTYTINDLNGEPITGTFYEKEFQKTNQKEFRIEKILKKR